MARVRGLDYARPQSCIALDAAARRLEPLRGGGAR